MRALATRDRPCARSNLLWDRRLSALPATGSFLFDRRPPLSSDPASGTPLSNRRQLQVWAARKGDGKQQRKPKSAVKAEEPQTAQAPAAPKPPPRIGTTPLPGGLKQRIGLVKAVKEYTKKPVQPAPQTRSWRKPKQSADELKEQRRREEEQLKLTKKESNNFALRQIHDSVNDYRRKAVLLVDGYNVIGDRKDKNAKEENEGLLLPGQLLEEERNRLIEDLADYSQKAGIRIIVAFDALHSGRPDNAEEVLSNGVTVVFCGACEADTYITTAVKRMLDKGYNLVAVASNDEMVRLVTSTPTVYHTKYGQQMVHHVSVRALKRDMDATYRQGLRALADYNDDISIAAGRVSKLSDLAALRLRFMRAAPATAAQAAGVRRRGGGPTAKLPGQVAGQPRAQNSSSDKSAP